MEVSNEYLRRFIESRIEPELNTGCWLWSTKAAHAFGYGHIGVRKGGKLRQILAHRASWTVYRGEIPVGMGVCHKCDTPACVNPSHLFLGTQRDNLRDMYRKGRLRNRGAMNGSAKLTEDQVRTIRLDARPIDVVAADYGVGRSTISRVRRREVCADVAS